MAPALSAGMLVGVSTAPAGMPQPTHAINSHVLIAGLPPAANQTLL